MIKRLNIVGLFIVLLFTLTCLLMPERSEPPATRLPAPRLLGNCNAETHGNGGQVASPPSTSPPAKDWHWRAGGGQVTHDVSWGEDSLVKIGVLAKRGADRCMEKWSPTAEYLTSRIDGKRFEVVPLDFEEVYSSVENGRIDFILANPSIYVELENRYGVNRIATLKNLYLGRAYTKLGGVIFCRADRKDINSLRDLKGKSFMSLDKSALGAWIAVRRELEKEGIDPYRDLGEIKFAGIMDAVVYAVRDGKADFGAVKTETLERMASEGKININAFHVIEHREQSKDFPFIHSTRLYPEWAFATMKETPADLAEKVAIALLEMPRNSSAAKAALCAGWTIPLNYQSVHECLKELKLGPYKDLGKITLIDVIRKYWYWILVASGLFLVMAGFTVVILKLNRRIKASHLRLQAEVEERKQAEKELLTYQEQLRALSSELLLTEERERRRLATDLHDRIGQALAISKIKIGSLRKAASSSGFATEVDEIRDLIEQTIEDTRTLTFELSPPVLYELGLEAAIEWLIETIQEQHGILIKLDHDRQPGSMDNGFRVLIYQATRELLFNVAKHSRARNAKVSVRRNGNDITIEVEDDGVGFDTSEINSHEHGNGGFGLFSIRERLSHLGGHLEVESEPGRGTRVTLVSPMKPKVTPTPPF